MMKSKITLYILIIGALVFFNQCEPKTDEFKPESGTLDLTKYVAVGNSLTAGMADGELYRSGQENSIPAIIAKQFAYVNNSLLFNQPLMKDDLGLGKKLILGYTTDCANNTSLAPVLAGGTPDLAGNTANIYANGPFQNMGVPGAKSFHVNYAGYAMANPYFGRFASSTTATILHDAVQQKPTFFTLWIGNNDVLGYATAGGNVAIDSITSIGLYSSSLSTILDSLTASGAKGAIATIPNVTVCPFFTTVKYNALLLDQATADLLNANYAAYNAAATQYGLATISFAAGNNAFIIQDNSHPLGLRQIKNNELITLKIPQDSIKCAMWGSAKPISENYVLTELEISKINQAVADFNTLISSVATTYNLALVDMNKYLNDIYSKGLIIDGKLYTSTFVTGNLFSLDGIHLTPQGNAIAANYFIEAINAKYGSSIPLANVNAYPAGIVFP